MDREIVKASPGVSGTQCECTSEACAKVEGYQRHPSGRCVKDAVVQVGERVYCQHCAKREGSC